MDLGLSQTVSTVATRCAPGLARRSSRLASAAAITSLGTAGSRMAAANSRSLVP